MIVDPSGQETIQSLRNHRPYLFFDAARSYRLINYKIQLSSEPPYRSTG
jgi:hypothetical protein